MLAASLAVTPCKINYTRRCQYLTDLVAVMSRPVAGVRNQTLVLTLPGSPKGAKENLEAVIKMLPHACIQAAGANSRDIHVGGLKKLEKEAGVAASSGKENAGT